MRSCSELLLLQTSLGSMYGKALSFLFDDAAHIEHNWVLCRLYIGAETVGFCVV